MPAGAAGANDYANYAALVKSCIQADYQGCVLDPLDIALVKYCIPRQDATCNVATTPVYVPASAHALKCECPSDNMAYNIKTRECEYCLFGSSSRYDTECQSPPACPLGHSLELAPENAPAACSAGYLYQAL
ncbi:MAG: hypothetical protein LBH41_02040 [Rickettsiales bacterium]|nr:hypothetical protein [Rickettsiales bacterium]